MWRRTLALLSNVAARRGCGWGGAGALGRKGRDPVAPLSGRVTGVGRPMGRGPRRLGIHSGGSVAPVKKTRNSLVDRT